ncbi:serine/arginine repetitive matrix protein 2-like isoform X3 [Penaeus indicus]|uniref:serine/arginine repetitive matrix protein 2-like isoform X3 n=1 Tax=Penaeus indicus TaxID=29960 RepID=UPI00300D5F2C
MAASQQHTYTTTNTPRTFSTGTAVSPAAAAVAGPIRGTSVIRTCVGNGEAVNQNGIETNTCSSLSRHAEGGIRCVKSSVSAFNTPYHGSHKPGPRRARPCSLCGTAAARPQPALVSATALAVVGQPVVLLHRLEDGLPQGDVNSLRAYGTIRLLPVRHDAHEHGDELSQNDDVSDKGLNHDMAHTILSEARKEASSPAVFTRIDEEYNDGYSVLSDDSRVDVYSVRTSDCGSVLVESGARTDDDSGSVVLNYECDTDVNPLGIVIESVVSEKDLGIDNSRCGKDNDINNKANKEALSCSSLTSSHRPTSTPPPSLTPPRACSPSVTSSSCGRPSTSGVSATKSSKRERTSLPKGTSVPEAVSQSGTPHDLTPAGTPVSPHLPSSAAHEFPAQDSHAHPGQLPYRPQSIQTASYHPPNQAASPPLPPNSRFAASPPTTFPSPPPFPGAPLSPRHKCTPPVPTSPAPPLPPSPPPLPPSPPPLPPTPPLPSSVPPESLPSPAFYPLTRDIVLPPGLPPPLGSRPSSPYSPRTLPSSPTSPASPPSHADSPPSPTASDYSPHLSRSPSPAPPEDRRTPDLYAEAVCADEAGPVSPASDLVGKPVLDTHSDPLRDAESDTRDTQLSRTSCSPEVQSPGEILKGSQSEPSLVDETALDEGNEPTSYTGSKSSQMDETATDERLGACQLECDLTPVHESSPVGENEATAVHEPPQDQEHIESGKLGNDQGSLLISDEPIPESGPIIDAKYSSAPGIGHESLSNLCNSAEQVDAKEVIESDEKTVEFENEQMNSSHLPLITEGEICGNGETSADSHEVEPSLYAEGGLMTDTRDELSKDGEKTKISDSNNEKDHVIAKMDDEVDQSCDKDEEQTRNKMDSSKGPVKIKFRIRSKAHKQPPLSQEKQECNKENGIPKIVLTLRGNGPNKEYSCSNRLRNEAQSGHGENLNFKKHKSKKDKKQKGKYKSRNKKGVKLNKHKRHLELFGEDSNDSMEVASDQLAVVNGRDDTDGRKTPALPNDSREPLAFPTLDLEPLPNPDTDSSINSSGASKLQNTKDVLEETVSKDTAVQDNVVVTEGAPVNDNMNDAQDDGSQTVDSAETEVEGVEDSRVKTDSLKVDVAEFNVCDDMEEQKDIDRLMSNAETKEENSDPLPREKTERKEEEAAVEDENINTEEMEDKNESHLTPEKAETDESESVLEKDTNETSSQAMMYAPSLPQKIREPSLPQKSRDLTQPEKLREPSTPGKSGDLSPSPQKLQDPETSPKDVSQKPSSHENTRGSSLRSRRESRMKNSKSDRDSDSCLWVSFGVDGPVPLPTSDMPSLEPFLSDADDSKTEDDDKKEENGENKGIPKREDKNKEAVTHNNECSPSVSTPEDTVDSPPTNPLKQDFLTSIDRLVKKQTKFLEQESTHEEYTSSKVSEVSDDLTDKADASNHTEDKKISRRNSRRSTWRKVRKSMDKRRKAYRRKKALAMAKEQNQEAEENPSCDPESESTSDKVEAQTPDSAEDESQKTEPNTEAKESQKVCENSDRPSDVQSEDDSNQYYRPKKMQRVQRNRSLQSTPNSGIGLDAKETDKPSTDQEQNIQASPKELTGEGQPAAAEGPEVSADGPGTMEHEQDTTYSASSSVKSDLEMDNSERTSDGDSTKSEQGDSVGGSAVPHDPEFEKVWGKERKLRIRRMKRAALKANVRSQDKPQDSSPAASVDAKNGQDTAVPDESSPSKEKASSEEEKTKKKRGRRKKEEGGSDSDTSSLSEGGAGRATAIQEAQQRREVLHEEERGRRLAQEIKGFNWLEQKIKSRVLATSGSTSSTSSICSTSSSSSSSTSSSSSSSDPSTPTTPTARRRPLFVTRSASLPACKPSVPAPPSSSSSPVSPPTAKRKEVESRRMSLCGPVGLRGHLQAAVPPLGPGPRVTAVPKRRMSPTECTTSTASQESTPPASEATPSPIPITNENVSVTSVYDNRSYLTPTGYYPTEPNRAVLYSRTDYTTATLYGVPIPSVPPLYYDHPPPASGTFYRDTTSSQTSSSFYGSTNTTPPLMSSIQSVKSPNSPPPAPLGSSAQQIGSSSSGSKSSSGHITDSSPGSFMSLVCDDVESPVLSSSVGCKESMRSVGPCVILSPGNPPCSSTVLDEGPAGLQRASSITSNTSSSPATSPGLIFSHKHALLKRAISDMLRSDSENSEESSKQDETTPKYANNTEPPEKLSKHEDSEGHPNVESSITEINLASPKSDPSPSAHSKSVIKNAGNIKKEKVSIPEEPQGFISLISPKESEEPKEEDVKPVMSEANNRELQMLQELPETVRHKVMKSMSESGCKFDEMKVDAKPSESVEEKYGRGDMQSSLLTALYEELMKTRQEVEKLRKVQELMLTEKEDKKDDCKGEVIQVGKDSSIPEKKVEKRKYLELTKDGDVSEESKSALQPEVKVAKIGIRSDLSEDSAKKSQTPVSTSRNFVGFTSPPTVISSPSEMASHSSYDRITSLVSNPTVTQTIPIPSSVITTLVQSGINLSSTSPNLAKISSQIEITSLPAPSTSPIVLQSSSLPRTSPVLPQTSPVLPRASPGLSRTSPPGSRTSPAVARISPSLSRISPSLSRTSPSLPRTSPSLPRTSPSLPRTSPGLVRTSPAASSAKERLPADLGANKLRALFGTNSEVEVMPITPGEKSSSYEPQQSSFLRLLDEPQQHQQESSLLLSAVRGQRREVEITASRDGTVFRQPHEDRRPHQTQQHDVERKKTHYSTSDLPEFPPTTHKPPPPLKPVPSVLRRHSESHDPRDPMLHRLMYPNNHSSPATPTTSSLPIDHHTAASLYPFAQPKSSPTQHPPPIQSGRRSSEGSSDMAREHQHAIALNMQQHMYRQQHLRPSPPLSLGKDKATIFPIPPPAPAVRPYRSPPPPPSTRSLEQYQSSMMDPASTEDLYRSNLQFFERIKQNIHQTCDANLSLQERGGFVGSERGIAAHDRMQSPASSVDKPPQPQTFVPRVLVRNSIPESSPRLPHIPPPYPGPSYVGHNPHLTGPLQPNHPGQYPNNMHHSSGAAIHQMAPAGLIPGMHQPSVIMTSPDNAVRSKNNGAGTVDKKQCLNNCPQQARFLCSGCKKAWYCSEKCQREHWAMHSQSCSP